mgnify:CR=1 FL=1
MDYMPVFVANGFYKNKTDFCNKHVKWARMFNYPKIDGYYDQGVLVKHRRDILITMDDQRQTQRHEIAILCEYDKEAYRVINKDRWDIYENKPIRESGKLCYLLRKVVNSDPDRILQLVKLLEDHPKTIIFYNYDYELELLKNAEWEKGTQVSEWNGHRHQLIPEGDKWVYLVQYTAGAEGWNCIETDTIIFYSLNYSYKIMVQSAGRIDRMNTPFSDLYYYRLKSSCPLDIAISRALKQKQNFNENHFCTV